MARSLRDETDAGEGERHSVTIDDRAQLTVRGVEHVDSFDNEQVVLQTSAGHLVIAGSGLSIQELNLDQGMFAVHGRVDSMEYREEVAAGDRARGLLARIFR